MHPKRQVDYSNFFSSGFRRIYTRGTRPRVTSVYSFSGGIPSGSGTGALKTPELLPLPCPDSAATHKRRLSLPLPSLILPSEEQRRRKIKKLFHRVNEAIPFRMLKETRKQPGPTGISNEDINDWINSSNGGGGSGSSGMSIRIGQGEHQSPTEPIDPFSPAPDTKSIYIDIPVSISPSPIPTIPRSPFIRSQSQPLPRSSSSFYSFPPPPPRRNSVRRPVSIHTTPIPMSPSPSTLPRRFSVRIEGDNYDKTWSWSVREEIVSLCPTPAAVEEERDEWMFDLGEVDWRQFHVELLDVNEEALINTTAGSLSPYLETDTYYYT